MKMKEPRNREGADFKSMKPQEKQRRPRKEGGACQGIRFERANENLRVSKE